MFVYKSVSVRASLRVRSVSQRRSGYSICRANLNDLVGSEMCHKGALMDEGEHGANDTAASACRHSRLMKAPSLWKQTFSLLFFFEKGKWQRTTHARQRGEPSDDFPRAADALRNIKALGNINAWWSGEFRKVSAGGDVTETKSNGLRDTGHFIHASSSIWVRPVIMESVCGGELISPR